MLKTHKEYDALDADHHSLVPVTKPFNQSNHLKKLNVEELLNFKGNFLQNDIAAENRYTCPKTGAHFLYQEICDKLSK